MSIRLVIIMSFVSLFCYGQNPDLTFFNLTTNDGLPSNECYYSYIDSKGFLWIGTVQGASIFDGKNINNFDTQDGLNELNINYIFETKDNAIWLCSMSGAIFQYNDGKIIPYRYNHIIKKYKGQYLTMQVNHISDDGSIYLSLYGLGILHIESNGRYTLIKDDSQFYVVERIANKFFGTMTINTEEKAKQLELLRNKLKKKNITHLMKIIGNEESSDFDYFEYLVDLNIVKGKDKVKVNIEGKINNIIVDKDGRYYVCFGEGGGLKVFQDKQALLIGQGQQFLRGMSISYLHFRETELYITTLDNGILIVPDINNLEWLKDEKISCLKTTSDGQYCGTINGYVYFIKNGSSEINNLGRAGNHLVSSILVSNNGKDIYTNVGKFHNTKWYSWKTTNNFQIIPKYIESTNKSNELIGNTFSSYYFFKPNEFVDLKLLKKPDTSRIVRINHFHYQKSKILLATNEGLYECDDKKCQKIVDSLNLLNTRINFIARSGKKTFVGTNTNGLLIFENPENIKVIDINSGLSSNNINHIHIENDSSIWVATNNGGNHLWFEQGKVKIDIFKKSNGLATDYVNCINTDSNYVYFATEKGLVRFSKIKAKREKRNLFIRQISLDGIVHKVNSTIKVKPSIKNIQISLLYLNYLLGKQQEFRYKLNDNEIWRYTIEDEISLFNLKYGIYDLSIEAKNEFSQWEGPIKLQLHIVKPMYLQSWFIIGTILSFLLITHLFTQRKIREKRKSLNLKLRMQQLEQSALQNQMNPHFLSNAFTSLQFFINAHQLDKADIYLAKLSRLIRLMLDCSRKFEITLKEELELINMYIEIEKLRFHDTFHFQLDSDQTIDLNSIYIPSMMIQPLVENAIYHGLLPLKERDPILNVKLRKFDNKLVLNIIDNGIGFKKKDKSDHESLSLNILKERAASYVSDRIKSIQIDIQTHLPHGINVELVFLYN